MTDSHGSPRGLSGIVEDLAPLVVGRDPRDVEAVYWDLYRATRQSPGGVVAKAIAAIENALLDLTGKSHGVAVYELFGGPLRTEVPAYWSHCGTTRARAWEVTGTPKLASYEDVTALGREVVERGFPAFKTNVVVPGDDPQVLHPGFHGEGLERNSSHEVEAALIAAAGSVRRRHGGQGRADRRPELQSHDRRGEAHGAALERPRPGVARDRLLRPGRPGVRAPLHVDPDLLRREPLRRPRLSPVPRGGRLDVASVDVIWNGFAQSKKIADLAETFEVNCAPHNYYSHLATYISAQWCAAIPNMRILEVDVDDVPWKDELTSAPDIAGGVLTVPSGPGWGAEVDEDVLRAHPVAEGLAKRIAPEHAAAALRPRSPTAISAGSLRPCIAASIAPRRRHHSARPSG